MHSATHIEAEYLCPSCYNHATVVQERGRWRVIVCAQCKLPMLRLTVRHFAVVPPAPLVVAAAYTTLISRAEMRSVMAAETRHPRAHRKQRS